MRTTNNRLLTQGDEEDDDDNVIKLKHTHKQQTHWNQQQLRAS